MKKIIIAIVLVVFLNNFDITALNLAVSLFTKVLHFTYSDIHLFSALYLLSCGIFFIPSGYFGDKYGYYKIFIIGTLLFLISSLLMASTHSATIFLISRSLQGISMALTLATVMPMIHITYTDHAFKKITLVTLSIALSQATGPILGAFIIHYLSWRYIFILNIPICTIALLISYPALTLKLHTTNSKGINILKSIGALFKSSKYTIIIFIRALFQFVYFGMLFILPVYFLLVLNHTILHASYYILSITLGFSIISILQIATQLFSNNKHHLWIGILCQVFGCLIYCIFGYYPMSILILIAGIIFGSGAALILPLTFAYALKYSPSNQKGIASGFMLCIAFIAGSLGAYISSHISLSSASVHIQSIKPFMHVCILYTALLSTCLILSITINIKGNKNARSSSSS